MTERFKPMFDQVINREWAGAVSWKDDAGATIHLPFCRATETIGRGNEMLFIIGMKRTFADGRMPGEALCARIHSHNEGKGGVIEIEDLGGALTRLLYCEVLRLIPLIAVVPPTFDAELRRCETLLASEQAADLAPPARPPITDPIDQAIYKIIEAADFDISIDEITAQLKLAGKPLSSKRVGERRRKIKAMGYQVKK
jgi:hypothetical protein